MAARTVRSRVVVMALVVTLFFFNYPLAVALSPPLASALLLPPLVGAGTCAALACINADAIRAAMGMAPWVPTPGEDLKALLAQANRTGKARGVFMDCGSGDGRNLILATREAGFTRGVGIEHSPLLAAISRLRIWYAGVDATIIVDDLLMAALPADAHVIYFYLAVETLEQLAPRLRTAYGMRREPVLVLSRDFPVPGWGEPLTSLDRGRTKLLAYEVGGVTP